MDVQVEADNLPFLQVTNRKLSHNFKTWLILALKLFFKQKYQTWACYCEDLTKGFKDESLQLQP